MIGKYINERGYSDIYPIGRIIGTRGKTIVIIQPVIATENKTKMEFISGGFAGICINQYEQDWEFEEAGKPFEARLTKGRLKQWRVEDKPRNFYDYNF